MTSETAQRPRRCERPVGRKRLVGQRPVGRERLVGRVMKSVADVVVMVRMIVACE